MVKSAVATTATEVLNEGMLTVFGRRICSKEGISKGRCTEVCQSCMIFRQ